jgi:serine/threonine protein kinase
MGHVVLAPSLFGDVAVKFVTKTSELRSELQHEAAMYHRLKHLQGGPIARLHYAGPVFENEYYGLCLEPLGVNLAEAIRRGGSKHALGQLALEVLKTVHSAGIVHGDLRLENFWGRGRGVVLIDLAFAKPSVDAEEFRKETRMLGALFI